VEEVAGSRNRILPGCPWPSSSIGAGSSGRAVVSASAFTAEPVPHLLEFYAPRIAVGVSAFRLALFDGSTSLGLIASLDAGTSTAGTFFTLDEPSWTDDICIEPLSSS